MASLIDSLGEVSDPRRGNAQRHELLDILAIALVASVCGAEGCVDFAEFAVDREPLLREFLSLKKWLAEPRRRHWVTHDVGWLFSTAATRTNQAPGLATLACVEAERAEAGKAQPQHPLLSLLGAAHSRDLRPRRARPLEDRAREPRHPPSPHPQPPQQGPPEDVGQPKTQTRRMVQPLRKTIIGQMR